MSKKRILVVCQHFWPETFRITDVCEYFIEQGYSVDVLCGIPNYPSGKFFEGYSIFKKRKQNYKGIRVFRALEIPRGNNTNARILLNFISFTVFSVLYIPRLLFVKYDRVLVYQLSPVSMSLAGIIIAKLKRIKLFIYICDFWPHSLFSVITVNNKALRWLITKASYWHYRRANGVIGVFKGIQKKLISEVGIPEKNTLYVPQVAEKVYEGITHSSELSKRFKGKFNVVFAGSINPAQSFDTVIEAAEIAIKKINNLNFIIVGDGMSKEWLINEVKKKHLTKFFTFEGFVPFTEVPKYQTVADALLVTLSRSPLFEYGIPAKVQSYLPAGKPIVAAMDGAGKDLINKSGAGICVNSEDAEGLAASLVKIAQMTKNNRDLMGKKALAYHHEHYDRDKNMKRLESFIFHDKRIPDKETII